MRDYGEKLCPMCGEPGAYESHGGDGYQITYCPPCEEKHQLQNYLVSYGEMCDWNRDRMARAIRDNGDDFLLTLLDT